ncbi:hypothetical protein SAMN05660909_02216 [Chitinophaga terrae (ex Kim and Jung 2007)]|jgi:DNA-binding ferritin-like protein|uniref:DNA starvation/stationary phase protection protein n=1 Tax=Chitinophaga terrae (ex Kim and Jung 2007) TaxID=408074 RepID=A0A1H4BPX6_9BACT|nr:DUF5856 family protein [Chitinophaga terrae (ex Kim and Jung 2007)]GEP89706.1 hypothetical protein CTE07_13510 [Chitinophaga terrae (ex Kim and Jung 2007)]SEA50206.1 hypothetical protein SAMN05660909_02216 [Chitinophaga terrae (ex Kim and Jung 2007)]
MSSTAVKDQTKTQSAQVSQVFGDMFAFNNSLKLIHWNITGKGSYAAHIALDEAIEDLVKATDRLVETTMATMGDMNIVIPETRAPKDHIGYIEGFYEHVDECRDMFKEKFTQSIIDEYQEAIKQLLYRLKRLS